MTGNQLKERRLGLGLTQEQLARDLDVVASTVARWEQLRDAEIPQSRMLDLSIRQLEAERKKRS